MHKKQTLPKIDAAKMRHTNNFSPIQVETSSAAPRIFTTAGNNHMCYPCASGAALGVIIYAFYKRFEKRPFALVGDTKSFCYHCRSAHIVLSCSRASSLILVRGEGSVCSSGCIRFAYVSIGT